MDNVRDERRTEILPVAAEIVAAYAKNNPLGRDDLIRLLGEVHRTLTQLVEPPPSTEPELRPAVPVRRSVTPEAIICLEDGKPFRSLKRHLATHHQLTPEAYREKWALPHDYPPTAPDYAARRSALAKANGLGLKSTKPVVARKRGPRAKAQ